MHNYNPTTTTSTPTSTPPSPIDRACGMPALAMSLSGPSRSTRADQEPHTTSPGALTVSRPRSQLCAERPMQRGPWTISVYVQVHALPQWQRPAALPTVAPAAPVAAGRSAHPPPRARAVQRCAQVKRQAEQTQSPLAGQLPPPAAWLTPVERRAAQQHGVTCREVLQSGVTYREGAEG